MTCLNSIRGLYNVKSLHTLILVFLCLLALSSGCLEKPHRKGESCSSNLDCLKGAQCHILNGSDQGICGCSPKEAECQDDTDCCEGLACKKEKCVELDFYCIASPFAGYIALGGIIFFIIGVLFTGISGGVSWKHPKYGTFGFIGSGGFIALGIIAVLFSLILWIKC